MHDLHEADKILKTILKYGQDNNFKRITKAKIDLGVIVEHGEELFPENLSFNILMLAKGTLAEGLAVEIEKVRGQSWVLKEIEGE